jgi:hypothetical protein
MGTKLVHFGESNTEENAFFVENLAFMTIWAIII